MGGPTEPRDSRLSVARYQVDKLTPESERDDDAVDSGQPTMEQRAQIVEISIQQAMRRGDFDDLPGAGKPLTGLQNAHDPNWWIRQKIERERLTGLGPPALTLRTEDSQLDERLDAAPSEDAVRSMLSDFNARIIEARRQLQGGPPVVTAPRDVDAEVERWRERRDARHRQYSKAREREEAAYRAMGWRERRRARRSDSGHPEPSQITPSETI
ncbi:protein of unknown function [Agreia bicolorata]|uniref:DnaJ homologue subfamily C member 28 conserved domain-containing protein n=1 Tax=Agreia bicolorata TaxID=110935 RepID=A0A1T4XUR2_9MICO|nr:DUF1992 domain-containing protein [Agreia bicolorata]SKA93244.1 protein of unknown function [Agreia bicolorata]